MRLGSGKRNLLGGLDLSTKRSLDTAITFVAINSATLQKWMGKEPSLGSSSLYTREADISIMLGSPDIHKNGQSIGACAAMALVILMGGKDVALVMDGMVAITGRIDLRGRIGDIDTDTLVRKSKGLRKRGVELFIVPQSNYEELQRSDFAGWPEDLMSYGKKAIKPVAIFTELMSIAVKGRSNDSFMGRPYVVENDV